MLNDVTLIGRVGNKHYRLVKNDAPLTTINLATYKSWTDKKGEKQEQTIWHNVNFFQELANVANKIINIGDLILIKGEIINKKITEGDKTDQWLSSITVCRVDLLYSPADENFERPSYFSDDFNVDLN